MPSKEDTYRYVRENIDEALEAFGAGLENAWLGIYQALLWYEGPYIHIIDADKLRSSAKRRASISWQTRAKAVERFLARQFRCEPPQVRSRIDRLMSGSDFQGLQRQNPLGIGFIGAVQYVLRKFGDSSLTIETEVEIDKLFRGRIVAGRTRHAKIDLVAFRGAVPKAIISCKWSVRHDRINDITNECPVYKSATREVYNIEPRFFLVTNEFDPARLTKILQDSCINGVVHVCKEVVTKVSDLDGRLRALLDLRSFVSDSHTW